MTAQNFLRSWKLGLEARNLSSRSIEQYTDSLRLFLDFIGPIELEEIEREHIEKFLSDQLARLKPSSALTRYKGLKLFFDWCVEEEELPTSPMARMKPPIVPEQPIPVVTNGELSQLLKVCAGKDFEARRDLAVLSLMADTGIRRAECAGLKLEDVDLNFKIVQVLGKGRRPRQIPFGATTARAIDRWLRIRSKHALAETDSLWLGTRSRTFSATGLRQMLERRGEQAGINNLHAHRLRHTFAHEHLSAGGNEGDLMMLAGWKSRQMLSRYASSTAAERARSSYRSPIDRLK